MTKKLHRTHLGGAEGSLCGQEPLLRLDGALKLEAVEGGGGARRYHCCCGHREQVVGEGVDVQRRDDRRNRYQMSDAKLPSAGGIKT